MAGPSLWEKRQAQLAKRGQQPKAPSVRPAAGLVEPPASIAVPAAPAVPVIAPESKPEVPAPAAPAQPKAQLPPLSSRQAPVAPAAPASKPPSAAPKPAPAPSAPIVAPSEPVAAPPAPVAQSPVPDVSSSGTHNLTSGEVEIVSEEPIAPPGPVSGPGAAIPDEAPSLSALIPDEAAPEAPVLANEAPAKSKSKPPAAELKRKESGTRSFKALSDNGWLPSRYKLTYTGQAPNNACNFLLIGKEERQLTLELNVPQKLTVSTKGGPMEVTLTYTGLSKTDGARQVEYVVEGGVSAVTGIMERFRNVGPAALSAWQSLKKHLPETIAIGFAAGLAVCGFTMDWVATLLGRFHPYVTAAVPAFMAGLALWTWAERSKDIRKENAKIE
jgi:hypothetical protein